MNTYYLPNTDAINAALRHIDTITFCVDDNTMSHRDLHMKWYYKLNENPGRSKRNECYSRNVTLPNSAVIGIRYRRHTFVGGPLVWITLSIPNVVQGNNYTMLPKGLDIVSIVNARLSEALARDIDITHLEVSSVANSALVNVGDMVGDYIQVAGRRLIEKCTRNAYNNSLPKWNYCTKWVRRYRCGRRWHGESGTF
jgi:hypothetical protein